MLWSRLNRPTENLKLSINQQFKNILVVDDEASVRELLRDCFEIEGFAVTEAVNGDEMNAILGQQPIDLITLDLNLGGENGFDLVRDIRATRNVPIVMITGKGDTIDRVVGLELGADDYITKPFHLRELLARVRTVLRRFDNPAKSTGDKVDGGNNRYRFDGWIADFDRLEVHGPDGQPCDLTTADLNLLKVFVTRANRVLNRDQLMDLLKGSQWSANDRSIDNQIARLRKKLRDHPPGRR